MQSYKTSGLPETEIKTHSKANSETWAWQIGQGRQKEKLIYCLCKIKKTHFYKYTKHQNNVNKDTCSSWIDRCKAEETLWSSKNYKLKKKT